MKTLSIITFSICLSILAACGGNTRSTPESLFKTAHEAVINKDVELLSECLTLSEDVTPEMTKAMASLIILSKSDQYEQFKKSYGDQAKTVKNQALNQFTSPVGFFNHLPDFDHVADSGKFDQEALTVTVQVDGRSIPYKLSKSEGQFTFLPPFISPSKTLITADKVMDEYMAAFESDNEEKIKEALNDLVLKYVEPTSLQYKDQKLAGKINGKAWTLNYGKAEQKEVFDKVTISLSFTNGEKPSDCRIVLPGDNVKFSVKEPGEYDFAQTGQNITLYDSENNKNTVLSRDGKLVLEIDRENGVAKGKIAAKQDENNFINGTFEVDICGEIE